MFKVLNDLLKFGDSLVRVSLNVGYKVFVVSRVNDCFRLEGPFANGHFRTKKMAVC